MAVLGLLDALDVRRAHLVGNSMGGFIAVEAATDEPERYSHLVLVAAAGIAALMGLLALAYDYLPAVQQYLPAGWAKWAAVVKSSGAKAD